MKLLTLPAEVAQQIIDDYKTLLEFDIIDEIPQYIKDIEWMI
jgi:hypothetical protein